MVDNVYDGCFKTGCIVEMCGEFMYGDAFRYSGVLILRIVEITREKPPLKHITCNTWEHRWEEHPGKETVVVKAGDWRDHGYDGVTIDD